MTVLRNDIQKLMGSKRARFYDSCVIINDGKRGPIQNAYCGIGTTEVDKKGNKQLMETRTAVASESSLKRKRNSSILSSRPH